MNSTLLLYLFCEIISILFMCLAKKRKSKKFFFLSLCPFSILFIIRGINVGTDYYYYSKAYLSLINGTLSLQLEQWLSAGFKILLLFLSSFFSKNFYASFACINVLSLYLIYDTIYKYCKHSAFALYILFCFCFHFQIFNQFRQMFAIALIFYSYRYIINNNSIKYFITVILAASIHTSAIVMLPMYFFRNKKINVLNSILCISIFVLIFLFFSNFKDLMSFSYYGRTYFGSRLDITTTSSIFNFVVRILLFTFVILFYKKLINSNDDKENTSICFLYNMCFLCTLLQLLVIKSYILARLTTYFYIFYVLLIPYVYDFLVKKSVSKKVWKLSFMVVLLIYQMVYYFSSSGASGGGYDVFVTFLK